MTINRPAGSGLPTVYSRPRDDGVALEVPLALDSWEAGGHRDQLRLNKFLAHAKDIALPLIEQLDDPLALRLDVGLAPDKDLLTQRDLDNYARPLAKHLAQASGRRFASLSANLS